jgi:hypothetical protein
LELADEAHLLASAARLASHVGEACPADPGGFPPKDLPVENYDKVELTLNLRTARELGLTIPPSVLIRADKVIE